MDGARRRFHALLPGLSRNGAHDLSRLSVRRRRAAVGIGDARPPADADARPVAGARAAAPEPRQGRAGAAQRPSAAAPRPSATPSPRCARDGFRHAIVDADRRPRSRGDRRGRGRFQADHRRLRDRARPAGEFPPPGPARRQRRGADALPRDRRRGGGAVGLVLGQRPWRRSPICSERAPAFTIDPLAARRAQRCGRGRRWPGRSRCWAAADPDLARPRRPSRSPRCRQRLGRERAGALVEEHHGRRSRAASSSAGCAGSSSPAARPRARSCRRSASPGLRIGRQIDPGVPWTVSLPASPADRWRWRSNPAISARPISSCAPFRCFPMERSR